ncbi:MAG: SAM-dependent methyltransferase [Rhodospirillales bacterium]|nr:SAM-dependent methyltransferase [Rhodospirillales bacterium]
MKTELSHRTNCRLCGSSHLVRVLELAPTPPANAFVPADKLAERQPCYPLDVWFCEQCAHLQLLDVVDPEILFRDYVYVSGTSSSFVRHFQHYAEDCIARFNPIKGALAVDIGSNDGSLLQFFKAAGMDVLGIDPAVKIAEGATARGLETWPEFIDAGVARRILDKKGPAALVTANNVFAHVDDLTGFAESVRDILAPDGVFVFEVSYAGDVHRDVLFDTIYHEHLDYHTVKPLIPFFAARGMELFSVKRVPTHGGSIRAFVQRAGGPHKNDGSVAAMCADEHERRLDVKEGWIAFADRIDALGAELTALLLRLKGEGKRIAGFGAPAKATTLMYKFGLDRDVIDYIIDDSPLKQDLYTPGKHVPVVSWSDGVAARPDYLVVLAWNFADAIIASHQPYREAGGHFIVPLPELKVV